MQDSVYQVWMTSSTVTSTFMREFCIFVSVDCNAKNIGKQEVIIYIIKHMLTIESLDMTLNPPLIPILTSSTASVSIGITSYPMTQ